MTLIISWLTESADRIADNVGTLGGLISAMGCAMCFPALASIGGALGLGFLARWEGLFINTLLPAFGWLVILAHTVNWFHHRQWRRLLAGMAGPTLVLLSLYPWWQYGWSIWTFYGGLALMVLVGIWDLVAPPQRVCSSDGRRRSGSSDSRSHQEQGS